MKVSVRNPQTGAMAEVSIGWDWPAFFSPLVFGIPFYLRGVYVWGLILTALEVLDIIAVMFLDNRVFTLIQIGVAIYLGLKGGEVTGKSHLARGYQFADSRPEVVQAAQFQWKITQPAAEVARSTAVPHEEAEWHYLDGTAVTGPHSASQLKALIKQGRITAETRVAKAGAPDWSLAREVPELSALF